MSDDTRGFLVGTAIIVHHKGKVLVSKRLSAATDGVGKVACPGGGMERTDKNILAAAARELLEETGLVLPDNATIFPAVEEGHRNDGTPYITHFVSCEIADISTLCNPEPHKHTDWEWVIPSELPHGTVLWSRDIIERVLAEAHTHAATLAYWHAKTETLNDRIIALLNKQATLIVELSEAQKAAVAAALKERANAVRYIRQIASDTAGPLGAEAVLLGSLPLSVRIVLASCMEALATNIERGQHVPDDVEAELLELMRILPRAQVIIPLDAQRELEPALEELKRNNCLENIRELRRQTEALIARFES